MKKTNKPNPLKTFNDNKAMAYKKAGGEMSAFKKSLIKANDGRIVGPQTEQEAKMSAIMNYQPPIPRRNISSAYNEYEQQVPSTPSYKKERSLTPLSPEQRKDPNQVKLYEMRRASGIYKKGGSVKRKK